MLKPYFRCHSILLSNMLISSSQNHQSWTNSSFLTSSSCHDIFIVCQYHWTIWRLFCLWTQKINQNQGKIELTQDFGNSIPGHGGVSDRLDCQLIMGAFVYFYYQSFMKISVVSTPSYIMSLLSPSDQLSLYKLLQKNLEELSMI